MTKMKRIWKFKEGDDLNEFLEVFMDIFDYTQDGYGYAKFDGKYILEVIKHDD